MDLSTLQTYVRDRLTISSSDTAKTTQITSTINQARYRLNAQFKLKVATGTLDFVADAETVDIPTDVTEIVSIYTAAFLLQPVTEMDFGQLTGGSGSPEIYVIDGASAVIRVRPVPTLTEVAAATIRYVQRPTVLSAAGDIPTEMPTEFHDLIAERAVALIAMNEEDMDLARGAAAVANDLELGLTAYMNRREGGTVSRQMMRGFSR